MRIFKSILLGTCLLLLAATLPIPAGGDTAWKDHEQPQLNMTLAQLEAAADDYPHGPYTVSAAMAQDDGDVQRLTLGESMIQRLQLQQDMKALLEQIAAREQQPVTVNIDLTATNAKLDAILTAIESRPSSGIDPAQAAAITESLRQLAASIEGIFDKPIE